MNAKVEPVKMWEWTAQLEEGFTLSGGEPWRGHRVRYREQGSRRWRSFLLSVDGDVTPNETMVLRAIEAHAGN